MKNFYTNILAILILNLLIIAAQGNSLPNQIDSLKQELKSSITNLDKARLCNDIAKISINYNPVETLEFANLSLNYLDTNTINTEYIRAIRNLGLYYYYNAKFDTSHYLFNKAYCFCKNINNDSLFCELTTDLGLNVQYLYNYDSASFYYIKSISYANNHNLEKFTIRPKILLSTCYETSAKYQKSLELLFNCETLCKKYNDQIALVQVYTIIGRLYNTLSNRDKSFKYYGAAKDIADNLRYKRLLATLSSTIGSIFLAEKQYKRGAKLIHEAFLINHQFNNKIGMTYNLLNLGISYHMQNKYDSALIFYDQAHTVADRISNKELLIHILKYSGKIYQTKGDYKTAKENYRKCVIYAEKLNSPSNLVFHILL